MIARLAVVTALSVTLASEASAWNDIFNSVWGPKGNDTGGIIPWSPENEANAPAIAEANCGWYNKFAVAVSIRREYGHYITYRCVWDPPYLSRRAHVARRGVVSPSLK
jgi:hypothetical protein